MWRLAFILCPSLLLAADLAPQLLKAAKIGQTARVQQLLSRGAPIESKDSNGRTALMIAADHAHPDVVKLLISRGANPAARDREGWTAYGLAFVSGDNHASEILKLLPQPAHGRITVEVKTSRENLYSSCVVNQAQLVDAIAALQLDAIATAGFNDAALAAKRLFDVTQDPGGDAVLTIKVRPGVSCQSQSGMDQLNFALDAKMVRARDQKVLMERTYGGGVKGLHVRTVNNPSQYDAYFREWAHKHGEQLYRGVLEAWLRS